MSEEAQQMALFNLLAIAEGRVPELRYAFHTPNGGVRNKATAARMRRMGARAGVPDILIPVRRGPYTGLSVEMKYGNNRPTLAQREWLSHLERQGWLCYVEYDWTIAGARILAYFGVAPGDYGLTAPQDCISITT